MSRGNRPFGVNDDDETFDDEIRPPPSQAILEACLRKTIPITDKAAVEVMLLRELSGKLHRWAKTTENAETLAKAIRDAIEKYKAMRAELLTTIRGSQAQSAAEAARLADSATFSDPTEASSMGNQALSFAQRAMGYARFFVSDVVANACLTDSAKELARKHPSVDSQNAYAVFLYFSELETDKGWETTSLIGRTSLKTLMMEAVADAYLQTDDKLSECFFEMGPDLLKEHKKARDLYLMTVSEHPPVSQPSP